FSLLRPPTPPISTLSLHDALPISCSSMARFRFTPSEPTAASAAMPRMMEQEKSRSRLRLVRLSRHAIVHVHAEKMCANELVLRGDRKSTRLNSSHEWSSYAVFCLK